jgi:hypothetical protein
MLELTGLSPDEFLLRNTRHVAAATATTAAPMAKPSLPFPRLTSPTGATLA